MKIAILTFPYAVSTSVTGPYDILTKSNRIFKQNYPQFEGDKLEVCYVGYQMEGIATHPLMPVSHAVDTQERFDLVIVPAFEPDHMAEVMNGYDELVDFIKLQYQLGSEIASLCFGAFLAARAGVFNGRRATTHWMGAQEFRRLFPKVDLQDDKILIDEGRVYSSGGAFTFTALIMYLVEKYCGHTTAIMASKTMLIDLYKDPQTSYCIFTHQKEHSDDAILEVQHKLEQVYSGNVNMSELASEACMSSRTFLRRFKKATGNTPLEYLQRVRIEAAKKLLESSDTSIEQISTEIGYEDYGSFLKLFKRYTSISPTAYRKRYRGLKEPEVHLAVA